MNAPTLEEQVRNLLRLLHYSTRTEDSYWYWIKRFILFHGKKHPREMGAPQIEGYLTHLAAQEKIAAATQNQAFHVILFLHRRVLGLTLRPIAFEAGDAPHEANGRVALRVDYRTRTYVLLGNIEEQIRDAKKSEADAT